MTALAPCGAPQTDPRVLPGYQGDDEHREDSALHPDVLAYAAEHGITRPRALAYLQAEYDRGMAERDRRADRPVPASPALVRTGRVRLVTGEWVDASVVADPVAERVAGRLDRSRRRAA